MGRLPGWRSAATATCSTRTTAPARWSSGSRPPATSVRSAPTTTATPTSATTSTCSAPSSTTPGASAASRSTSASRYDRYNNWTPEQQQVAFTHGTPQLSIADQTFARADVNTWNSFAPRIGVVYDLRGDGQSVIKANYGLYWHNPGVGLVGERQRQPVVEEHHPARGTTSTATGAGSRVKRAR